MSYDESDARWDRYEDTLRSVSEEAVPDHLGTIGDAIEALIKSRVAEAQRLLDLGFYGPALVTGTSAIELIIRFLLVRPLVSGAFLSDEWAAILSEKIGSGRTDEDRRILPDLLAQWKIKLDQIALPDGTPLWPSLKDRNGLRPLRTMAPQEAETPRMGEFFRRVFRAPSSLARRPLRPPQGRPACGDR